MSTESSPFSQRPGAVGDPPEHYGNPLVEQRALLAGEAIVDLSDRGVLSITGPDRLSWIDSITSQSVAGLAAGRSAETLVLDPSGRIQSAIRLVDDGETLWLLVDEGAAESLHDFLERMRFLLRVEVADRSEEFTTVARLGDAPPAELDGLIARRNGVALEWRDPWSAVVSGGVGYAEESEHPGRAWTLTESLVPWVELAGLAASRVAAAGTLALEALRVAAWRPRQSAEVDATTIPHELDWLRSAVHLDKGCYRGQETVAKVHNLGRPPRRLVLLHLDGSESVFAAAGDEVYAGDKLVGRVTSPALHHELGPIALAVVRRATDPAAVLEAVTADGVRLPATQEIIVPPTAGAAVDVPRLPRLGGRQGG